MSVLKRASTYGGKLNLLSWRTTFTVLFLTGVTILSTQFYLSYLVSRFSIRHTGHLTAIYEIETLIVNAHLDLSDERIGNQPHDINAASDKMKEAESLLGMLFSGGDFEGVRIVPIKNPALKQKAVDLKNGLDSYRIVLEKWLDEYNAGELSSETDRSMHEGFTVLLSKAETLETKKRIQIEQETTFLTGSTRLLMALSFFFIGFAAINLYRSYHFQKVNTKALRESEGKLRTLIETLPQLIWTSTPEGLCDYLSPQWIEYTGTAAEEQYGYGWAKHIHPDDWQKTESVWAEAVKTGSFVDVEFRIRRYDGVYRWFKTRALPLFDASGQIIKWFGMNLDIEDLIQAEQTLEENEERLTKLNAELQRSNNELEQFAYVASHDLQEPLRMVASFTQLLANRYKGKLDSDADEFIEFTIEGATRLQKLINDLLLYSRINTRSIEFERVDCEVVLENALRNLALFIDESEAVVTHDQLPVIKADATQIEQLFQNLVGNAVKFRGEERPSVHVSSTEKSDAWVISIRDNGIGIDDQFFDKVFEVFQRLHARNEYSGTGIGLSIAKRIVERHGGKIWIESEPGKGSTFFFSIPK